MISQFCCREEEERGKERCNLGRTFLRIERQSRALGAKTACAPFFEQSWRIPLSGITHVGGARPRPTMCSFCCRTEALERWLPLSKLWWGGYLDCFKD